MTATAIEAVPAWQIAEGDRIVTRGLTVTVVARVVVHGGGCRCFAAEHIALDYEGEPGCAVVGMVVTRPADLVTRVCRESAAAA